MRRIFFDDDLEKCIGDEGYAVVKSMVPESVCDELSAFFEQTDSVDKRAFTISNWNNNEDYRRKTFDKIVAELSVFANACLQNYKPVMGVFASKRPQLNSDMLLHQDWSLVDETKFRSVSIWLALWDVDHNNGNLEVAARSHIYAGTPRGMNIPVPFEEIRGSLQAGFLTGIPLRKGDAIVFDHRLVHGSPANKSDKVRLAAVLALIPDEAELIHYFKYWENNEALEILKMREEEFHLIDFFDMPNKPKHIKSLGFVPAAFRQITLDEVKLLQTA